jgi:glucose-1-phosphate thymidylyltransferase
MELYCWNAETLDMPMRHIPLSVLMMAGIRDILIISTPKDLPNFERLLGDGSHYGVRFSYKVQPSPDGLAQAFLLGEEFIAGEPCALVLGDNIFYGNGLGATLRGAVAKAESGEGASVFGYYVDDPERYGVVEFDENKKAISIVEKPEHPASNYAVTGLYFYDEHVVEYAKRVEPSARGELEITDLNRMYLDAGMLNVRTLGRGYAWLDTGTMDSLFEAGEFVRTVQRAQGLPIAIVEEIAFENGWITRDELMESADRYGKSPYGQHLKGIADGEIMLVPNQKN